MGVLSLGHAPSWGRVSCWASALKAHVYSLRVQPVCLRQPVPDIRHTSRKHIKNKPSVFYVLHLIPEYGLPTKRYSKPRHPTTVLVGRDQCRSTAKPLPAAISETPHLLEGVSCKG